jgi:hypothetical protein
MRLKFVPHRQSFRHTRFADIAVMVAFVFTTNLMVGSVEAAENTDSLAGSESSVIQSFEGQVMRCSSRADVGRMAYQVKSMRASLRPPNLEIEADIQTLKCRERGGVLRFEQSGLGGRSASRNGGFIEFTGLELVGFTPDLKVFRSQALDMKASQHRLKLSAPAGSFVGLLPRNTTISGDRQVVFMTMLRGQANLGELASGQIVERSQETLGTYGFRMTESSGHLVIRRTPRLASAGHP